MGACVLAYWAERSLALVWANGLLLGGSDIDQLEVESWSIPNQHHDGLVVVYFTTD